MGKRPFPPPDPVGPPPPGEVPGAHAKWTRGGGFKDNTDPRRHRQKAKGGKVERRFVQPGWSFDDMKKGDVELVSVSLVNDPLPGYEFHRVDDEKKGLDKPTDD
jgi:hypothetical protein